MDDSISGSGRIAITHDRPSVFSPFLQKGARIQVETGCSISAMLCGQFGISADYIDNRIKTIFLDGHPVDDVNTAVVQDGATLALAAAMPGLVGAILRRGGDLASLRSTISYRSGEERTERRDGVIVIKLFNLVIRELGPVFLKSGIRVSTDDLLSFFRQQRTDFWSACRSVEINNEPVDPEALKQLNSRHIAEYVLQVVSPD